MCDSRRSDAAGLQFRAAAGMILRHPESALTFLAAGFCALAFVIGLWWRSRTSAVRRLSTKLEGAVDHHIDRLVRVRAQWVRFDEDGRVHSTEWEREIDRFLDGEVSATLDAGELRRLEADRARFVRLVADLVAAGAARPSVYQ